MPHKNIAANCNGPVLIPHEGIPSMPFAAIFIDLPIVFCIFASFETLLMKPIIKTIIALLSLCPMASAAQKYVGGDISLLPTYEAHGVRYLDQKGVQVEPLPYFGNVAGWNAMRVRLFVDPSKAPADDVMEGVRQDLNYATALCKRIKEQGHALMLDFHYSDTWTDPGQHSTPSTWNSEDPDVLADSLYRYTQYCLTHLKANGATPDFVQIGNEITYGMLWPTGKCLPDGRDYASDVTDTNGTRRVNGTFANLVKYLQAGAKATRETCPQARIIIHLDLSSSWSVTNFYKTLGSQVDYDIIGLSYYPDWHGPLSTLAEMLNVLETDYPGKEIMVVETGYGSRWALNGQYTSTVQTVWPCTEAGQKQFVLDLITELNKHPKVTGLFWWMPEDNEFWADQNPANSGWWNASLYTQDTGKPLAAMFELQRFIGKDPTGIEKPVSEPATNGAGRSENDHCYNIKGQRLPSSGTLPQCVVIKKGKKYWGCKP